MAETSQRAHPRGRPLPDEAPLREHDLPDLSVRGWLGIFVRAAKEMLNDNMLMIASALAYSSFFAIPSVLLVVVGLFTLIAGPGTIASMMQSFTHVMPGQATSLLHGSLNRLDQQQSATIAMTVVGFVLALWSTTGAMTSYMTALNMAYDREKDRRSFVKKRATALAMVACIGAAFVLIAVFLIFGPPIERWVGGSLGIQSVLAYVWWAAQWPVLVAGLLAAFATLLWLGPDVDPPRPRWKFVSPGSVIAAVIWLAVSAAFAVYTSQFGSYNKTWGSLSAVIVMLTWLWLTGLALLYGAEFNAELERSRAPRRG